MNAQPDLCQIERDVHSTVRESDRRLGAHQEATRALSQHEGERLWAGRRRSGPADSRSADRSAGLPPVRQAMAHAERDANQMRDRLLTAQRTLRRYLADWESDLNVLTRERAQGRGAAAQFQAAREASQDNVQTIRNLLGMVSAALARARRAMDGAPGSIDAKLPRAWHEGDRVGQGGVGMTAVTFETVALLDALRYEKTNCRLLLAYPTPRLSPRSNEGDGGLGGKILAGLGLCSATETQELRIEVAGLFRRLFRSGRDISSGTHQWNEE